MANALRKLDPNITIDFATSISGIENDMLASGQDLIDHQHQIDSGPMHGVNPLRMASSGGRIVRGFLQSISLLRKIKPDAIFLTGGWVGLPVALSARVLSVPVVIFVPDIEPGRTLKLLGRFAQVITCTAQDTEKFYPYHKQVIETGYPLREGLLHVNRQEGLAYFGLDADKRTLLVFGGSRGSLAINNVILDQVDELMKIEDLQILHVTGKFTAEDMQKRYEQLPDAIKARYYLYDYVEEFHYALAVADLIVCRAGASTLGEFPIFEAPAILVPLAYEWRYQEINADWLAERNAAIRLDEPEMEAKLVLLIQDLLQNSTRMTSLKAGLAKLARTDGATNIAKTLLEFVK